jgi:hypothetical protein
MCGCVEIIGRSQRAARMVLADVSVLASPSSRAMSTRLPTTFETGSENAPAC